MRKTVLSSRSNPENNPKVPSWKYLERWKNDPDVYISFTQIDKLGINPQSKYNTPIGIYTYPLAEAWREYKIGFNKTMSDIPFAGGYPTIWVLRANKGRSFIEDMHTDYGSNNFDHDENTLKKLFIEERMKYLQDDLDNTNIHGAAFIDHWKANYKSKIEEDWHSIYEHSLATARIKNPVCSFWNLSRLIAVNLVTRRWPTLHYTPTEQKSCAIKWNWVLRNCGYSGFADLSGKGYIHPSEPIQAVFLSKTAFKVIGKCANKDYLGTDKRPPIENMLDFITAVGRAEQMYDEKNIDYIKNLMYWLVNVGAKLSHNVTNISLKVDQKTLWGMCNKNMFEILLSICKNAVKEDFDDRRFWIKIEKQVTRCYITLGEGSQYTK